jgi:hypothetical protein
MIRKLCSPVFDHETMPSVRVIVASTGRSTSGSLPPTSERNVRWNGVNSTSAAISAIAAWLR